MSSVELPGEEFVAGTILAGRLKVLRRLGAGGVGAVYEVEHQVTRHRRALKILHPRFRAMPEVVERFLREGSAAGRIGNPHIVETFDAGELDNGAPWLLMELLEGEPLSELLRRCGRLDFGPACALLAEVALAVQAAHDANIVHRDLKPDNLYVVERDGRPFVKVLDFGMSKFDSGVTGALSVTAEGTTLGTPLYMAPEQMRGAKGVDFRADLYALGVILYEALAGGTPYNAQSFAELAVLVLGGGCPRLESLRPGAPAGLGEVVHRAMAVDPAQRHPSARLLAEALAPFARLSSHSGSWWRRDAEAGGLDRTAQRTTPLQSEGTFPSTPSPMPPAPAASSGPPPPPIPAAPAAPLAIGLAVQRGLPLTRRWRQLGVVATAVVVWLVYSHLQGGRGSTRSSQRSERRQQTAGAHRAAVAAPDGGRIQPERAAVLVVPLKATDVYATAATVITASIVESVGKLSYVRAISVDELSHVIGSERRKELMRAEQDELPGFAGEAAARYVIGGNAGALGSLVLLQLFLLDTSTSTIIARTSVQAESGPEGLLPKIDDGVRLLTARLVPNVTRQAVSDVVRAGRGMLQFCYEEELRKDPKLEGKMLVKFVIAPDGQARDVSLAEGSTLKTPSLERCLQAGAASWRFPPSGEPTQVVYPFGFKPGK